MLRDYVGLSQPVAASFIFQRDELNLSLSVSAIFPDIFLERILDVVQVQTSERRESLHQAGDRKAWRFRRPDPRRLYRKGDGGEYSFDK